MYYVKITLWFPNTKDNDDLNFKYINNACHSDSHNETWTCDSQKHFVHKTEVVGARRLGVRPNSRHSSLISDYRDSKGKANLKVKVKVNIFLCVCVPWTHLIL